MSAAATQGPTGDSVTGSGQEVKRVPIYSQEYAVALWMTLRGSKEFDEIVFSVDLDGLAPGGTYKEFLQANAGKFKVAGVADA